MKDAVRSSRWHVLLLLAALVGFLFLRAPGDAQTVDTTLERERTIASEALSMLEQQVARASAPDEVRRWLEVGRSSTEELMAVENPTEERETARQHFRRATQAFARVSRWLRENEPDDTVRTEQERLQRLRRRVQRTAAEVRRLSHRASAQGIPLDFSEASDLATAAQQALATGDHDAAAEISSQLVTELDALHQELADAFDGRGDR